MTRSQNIHYPALTGLRALSAYMVFLFHANPFDKEGWQSPLFRFTNELHVGVSLFFVLSGFLIYTRYSEEFQFTGSWFKHYLQNRFAKIYPLYFVVLITLITLTLFQSHVSLTREMVLPYAINFSLLQGFFDDLKFTGIMQAWSLTVEECFYISIPLILLWQKRFSVFLLPLLLISLGIVLVIALSPVHFFGLFSDIPFMMEYTFFGRCFEFFAGIILAIYLKKQPVRIAGKYGYTLLGFTALIILICVIACFSDENHSGIDHPAGRMINNFFIPIAAIVLLFGLITEKNYLQKILSTPVADILGKSSYAFYLIHAGYFYEIIYYQVSHHTAVIFIVMNLMAVVLYYAIEKPMNNRWRAKES